MKTSLGEEIFQEKFKPSLPLLLQIFDVYSPFRGKTGVSRALILCGLR